ncbi:MAG: hypothetical protein ACI9R3_001301 [Verrucomicrobiales bacterium]
MLENQSRYPLYETSHHTIFGRNRFELRIHHVKRSHD